MDNENLDVDMDQLMEMIDEMPEDSVLSAFTSHESDIEPESEPEQEAREPIRQESKDAKIAYDAMNENLRLQQENERLKAEKLEAERIAMHGVVRNFETQIEFENGDIKRLERELVRARDEGDSAASVDIESNIRNKYERIRDLKGKVDQYVPYLNQTQTTRTSEAPSGNEMASEWLKENASWLQDDRNKDKREFADNVFKEMTASGMNINNVNFWTKMEKRLTEYDLKKLKKNLNQGCLRIWLHTIQTTQINIITRKKILIRVIQSSYKK